MQASSQLGYGRNGYNWTDTLFLKRSESENHRKT